MLGILTSNHTMTLAFINDLFAPSHMIIILVIALLIFGHRLPEVGRSLGKSIVEFKKGIKGIEDEIESESAKPSARIGERVEAPAARVREGEPSSASTAAGDHRGA